MKQEKPKKPKGSFWRNGKKYPHYNRHKANTRMVCFDIFKKDFEERSKRKINPEEVKCFITGFNYGYKECRKRSKEENK